MSQGHQGGGGATLSQAAYARVRRGRRTVIQSREDPSCWRIAKGSTAPLTSKRRSPALTSRGSPGNWRFHAPT
eukprot:9305338-Alexandrium_andersonii.AAC.1